MTKKMRNVSFTSMGTDICIGKGLELPRKFQLKLDDEDMSAHQFFTVRYPRF